MHHPILTLLIIGVVVIFLLPAVCSGFSRDLQEQRDDEDDRLTLKNDYVFDRDLND